MNLKINGYLAGDSRDHTPEQRVPRWLLHEKLQTKFPVAEKHA